jgi:hypothetical protein
MLLIYGTAWGALTSSDAEAGAEFQRSLHESGELVALAGMADAGHSRVVRATAGPPVVTKGPYLAGEETLAGWFVVDCESRERAVELAARYPGASGGVEVWPLLEGAGTEM